MKTPGSSPTRCQPARSEAKSKDPAQGTLKIAHRDPSTALGMTHVLLLLSLGIVLMLIRPCAAAPFQFEETGSLALSRNLHGAVLLANGKVLVAGGDHNLSGNRSAELYDPATGIWTPTGNMVVKCVGHTLTLLPNGKVLAAGVDNPTSNLRSAEIYDPVSGTWTLTGNLLQSRSQHTATLLPNGKVLIAGGDGFVNGGYRSLDSAELYDPATGTWTAAGSLVVPTERHTAI